MLPERLAVRKLEVPSIHGQCCAQTQVRYPTPTILTLPLTETAESSLHVELASQGPDSKMNVQEKASDFGSAVEKQVQPPTRQKDELVGIGSVFG
jgi:hypothetical protein